jgi:hypothetical protein
MSYYKTDVAHKGLFSSGGTITTAGNDEVISIQDGDGNDVSATSIAIDFLTNCEINFDESANYHPFLAGDKVNFDRVTISKLKVKNAASQLRFYGLFV